MAQPNTHACKQCGRILSAYENDVSICTFCRLKNSKGKYSVSTTSPTSYNCYSNQAYKPKSNNTFLYVISFIIPLVGIIAGAIMLSSEDYDRKSCGKKCIVLSIISAAIICLFSGLLYWLMMLILSNI